MIKNNKTLGILKYTFKNNKNENENYKNKKNNEGKIE